MMKPSIAALFIGLSGITCCSAISAHPSISTGSSGTVTSFPGHRVTRPIPTHTSAVEEPSATSSSSCFYFCPRCPRGVCLYRCMTICPDFSATHHSPTPVITDTIRPTTTTFSSTPVVQNKPKKSPSI